MSYKVRLHRECKELQHAALDVQQMWVTHRECKLHAALFSVPVEREKQ
jgi:hypothetical protein